MSIDTQRSTPQHRPRVGGGTVLVDASGRLIRSYSPDERPKANRAADRRGAVWSYEPWDEKEPGPVKEGGQP